MLAAVPTIITCANSSSFIFFGIPCRKQCSQNSSGIKSNFHLGAETFTISNLPITGAIVGNHNLQKVFDILIFRYMINIITGNRYNFIESNHLAILSYRREPFLPESNILCIFFSFKKFFIMCSDQYDTGLWWEPSFQSLPSQRTAWGSCLPVYDIHQF